MTSLKFVLLIKTGKNMKFSALIFILVCLCLNYVNSHHITYGGTGAGVLRRSIITAEPSERNVRYVVFPVS